MNSVRSIKVLVLVVALGATLMGVAMADHQRCENLLREILSKRQKPLDGQLSNWDKFYEISSESLKSDRIADLAELRTCMELYQQGDAMDKSNYRNQERLRDMEFKVRMAEDSTKLKRARFEAAQLLQLH